MSEQPSKPATNSEVSANSTTIRPNYEDVAVLAYSLWEGRGRPQGTPEEDWFKAEEILSANGVAAS